MEKIKRIKKKVLVVFVIFLSGTLAYAFIPIPAPDPVVAGLLADIKLLTAKKNLDDKFRFVKMINQGLQHLQTAKGVLATVSSARDLAQQVRSDARSLGSYDKDLAKSVGASVLYLALDMQDVQYIDLHRNYLYASRRFRNFDGSVSEASMAHGMLRAAVGDGEFSPGVIIGNEMDYAYRIKNTYLRMAEKLEAEAEIIEQQAKQKQRAIFKDHMGAEIEEMNEALQSDQKLKGLLDKFESEGKADRKEYEEGMEEVQKMMERAMKLRIEAMELRNKKVLSEASEKYLTEMQKRYNETSYFLGLGYGTVRRHRRGTALDELDRMF
jgi:hypothetical protein